MYAIKAKDKLYSSVEAGWALLAHRSLAIEGKQLTNYCRILWLHKVRNSTILPVKYIGPYLRLWDYDAVIKAGGKLPYAFLIKD